MNVNEELYGLIRRHLHQVRRSGPENIMAICPFHARIDGTSERKGSFSMNITTGLWFCHSCHEKGNLRTFLRGIGTSPMLIDMCYKPLLEAIEEEVRKSRGSGRRCLTITLNEEALPESILGLFDYCPMGLLEEGFSEATLRRFDVGFDRKNNRITYPLRDLMGRLLGFSGKAVDPNDIAKYKVYAKDEYEVWGLPSWNTDRNNLLWNCERVYPEAMFSKNPEIVLVEGFKACMWLWQAGYTSTIALMGSYMSPMQKLIFERMGGTVYLFLDNDAAGHKGYNYISRMLSSSISVRIVRYQGPQPTDLTESELHAAINQSVDYHRWVLQEN